MPPNGRTPAHARYQRRVVIASLLYAGTLFAAAWVFKHQAPTGAAAYGMAVLPALPLVGVFVALGLYLREEGDEYQRHVTVQQILFATGCTLIMTTTYGFLESFVAVHHFEAYWAAVVWFFFFGVGRFVREML